MHCLKAEGIKIKLNWYLIKENISKNNLQAKNLITENGFFYLLKMIFKKLIYDRKTLVLFSSDLKDNQIIKPKINVVLIKPNLEELNKLIKSNSLLSEKFKRRFYRNNECFVFLKDNKLVHYSWINFKEMDITELKIKIPLNEKEACIFDCVTLKESRGLNLYPSMLCKIKEYLYNKGYTKCFIYADIKNKSSIKGIEKVGFERLKLLSYLKFFVFKKKKIEDIK